MINKRFGVVFVNLVLKRNSRLKQMFCNDELASYTVLSANTVCCSKLCYRRMAPLGSTLPRWLHCIHTASGTWQDKGHMLVSNICYLFRYF